MVRELIAVLLPGPAESPADRPWQHALSCRKAHHNHDEPKVDGKRQHKECGIGPIPIGDGAVFKIPVQRSTAVHSASHRQASAASVHRAAAPHGQGAGWAAATGSEEAGDVMTVYGSRTGQRMQMCDGRRLTGGLQTQARPL